MEILSVCLSDIPKEKIKKSDKNGKLYFSIVVSKRKEVDQFDNDLTVGMSKTKEERELKADTIYVGSGKTYDNKPENVNEMAVASESDLEALEF